MGTVDSANFTRIPIRELMYSTFFKPITDILLACALLVLFSPVLLLLAVLIFITVGGSPFFSQLRPGKQEKIFKIYKFKTMNDAVDENGNMLPDHLRLTPIGTFLRKASLDELPQLFNVLKGDMSFIGPRPLLISYLPFYTQEERQRHTVKPGITGLAQVSGRNYLNWDKRLGLDVEYAQNVSFTTDKEILLKTIKKVLFHEDVAVAAGSYIIDLDDYRKK